MPTHPGPINSISRIVALQRVYYERGKRRDTRPRPTMLYVTCSINWNLWFHFPRRGVRAKVLYYEIHPAKAVPMLLNSKGDGFSHLFFALQNPAPSSEGAVGVYVVYCFNRFFQPWLAGAQGQHWH